MYSALWKGLLPQVKWRWISPKYTFLREPHLHSFDFQPSFFAHTESPCLGFLIPCPMISWISWLGAGDQTKIENLGFFSSQNLDSTPVSMGSKSRMTNDIFWVIPNSEGYARVINSWSQISNHPSRLVASLWFFLWELDNIHKQTFTWKIVSL